MRLVLAVICAAIWHLGSFVNADGIRADVQYTSSGTQAGQCICECCPKNKDPADCPDDKTPKVVPIPIDITFLIDGSDSILEDDFDKVKQWTLDVVDAFRPSEIKDGLQVDIAQFSHQVALEVNAHVATTANEIRTQVMNITQMKSGTHTFTGLRFINQQIVPQLRDRSYRVLITITDGRVNRVGDNRDPNAEHEDEIIAKANYHFKLMVGVGVGDHTIDTELEQFSNNNKSFHVEKFDELQNIIENIKQSAYAGAVEVAQLKGEGSDSKSCEDEDEQNCLNDIMVAIDSSACFRDHHRKVLRFVNKLVKKIGREETLTYSGSKGTRLSVMQFSSDYTISLELDAFNNYASDGDKSLQNKVLKSLQQLTFMGEGAFLNKALNATVQHFYDHPREGAKKFLILVTNANSHSDVTMTHIEQAIVYLRTAGINVIPIAITRQCLTMTADEMSRSICPNTVVMEKLAGPQHTFLEMKSQEIMTDIITRLKCPIPPIPEEECMKNCTCQCELPVGPQGPQGPKGDAIKGDDGLKGDRGPQGPKGQTGPPGGIGERGQVGPKGEQGPQGDPGEAGQKGEPGMPGKDGKKGEEGPIGLKGEIGHQGQKGGTGDIGRPGRPGEKGAKGATGIEGPKGDTGARGPKGEPGRNGVGIKGERGPKGLPGVEGVHGSKGELGPNGIPGPPGLCGKPGPAGRPGEPGVPGLNGIEGPIGPPGIQGPRGENGPQGPLGKDGTKGEMGMPGKRGIPGARGHKGPQGNDGSKGDKGEPSSEPGPQGVKGNQGLQGLIGLPGLHGTDGPQGPRGIQGPRGPPGVTGPPGEPDLNILRPMIVEIIRDLLPGDCGTEAPPPVIHYPMIDLTFLIDGSDSILPEDFTKICDWILDVTDAFKPREVLNGLQIDIVQFSEKVQLEVHDNVTTSSDQIRDQVFGIQQMKSGTKTYKGLRYVNSDVIPNMRDGSYKVLITVTDGRPVDDVDLNALNVADKYFKLMVGAAVGDKIKEEELSKFSTNEEVYPVEDFAHLKDIIDDVRNHALAGAVSYSEGN